VKPEKIEDTLKNKEIVNNNKEDKKEVDLNEEKRKEVNKDTDKVKVNEKVKETESDKETPLIENVAPKKDREGLKRTVSAPPSVTEVNAPCTCCCVENLLHVHEHHINQKPLFAMWFAEKLIYLLSSNKPYLIHQNCNSNLFS
jgi:hypothetical protein